MFIFKKKYFLLFLTHFFLVGCAVNISEKIGVSDLEWMSYSQDKQKVLLANYDEVLKKRESELERQTENQNLSGTFLTVKIYGGKIMFPPSFINWQDYKPVHFTIFKGQCRNIEMMRPSAGDSKTELGVCFQGNVLYLDPSHYDLTQKAGSFTIYHSPLWVSGFSYKDINSSGYVRLSNVTVEIKQKWAPPVNKKIPPKS
jgi:hypothetical protein